MSQIVRFSIGDWSDDGHGGCSSFLVKSNVDVKVLREAHYAAEFNISEFYSDYDVTSVKKEGWLSELLELGLLSPTNKFLSTMHRDVLDCLNGESTESIGSEMEFVEFGDDEFEFEEIDIVRVWCAALEHNNPGISLELLGEESDVSSAPVTVMGTNPEIRALLLGLLELIPAQCMSSEHAQRAIEVTTYTAPKIVDMHFYGFDSKNRHLNVPGYGIFQF